jgi:hypothetical protein
MSPIRPVSDADDVELNIQELGDEEHNGDDEEHNGDDEELTFEHELYLEWVMRLAKRAALEPVRSKEMLKSYIEMIRQNPIDGVLDFQLASEIDAHAFGIGINTLCYWRSGFNDAIVGETVSFKVYKSEIDDADDADIYYDDADIYYDDFEACDMVVVNAGLFTFGVDDI